MPHRPIALRQHAPTSLFHPTVMLVLLRLLYHLAEIVTADRLRSSCSWPTLGTAPWSMPKRMPAVYAHVQNRHFAPLAYLCLNRLRCKKCQHGHNMAVIHQASTHIGDIQSKVQGYTGLTRMAVSPQDMLHHVHHMLHHNALQIACCHVISMYMHTGKQLWRLSEQQQHASSPQTQ